MLNISLLFYKYDFIFIRHIFIGVRCFKGIQVQYLYMHEMTKGSHYLQNSFHGLIYYYLLSNKLTSDTPSIISGFPALPIPTILPFYNQNSYY